MMENTGTPKRGGVIANDTNNTTSDQIANLRTSIMSNNTNNHHNNSNDNSNDNHKNNNNNHNAQVAIVLFDPSPGSSPRHSPLRRASKMSCNSSVPGSCSASPTLRPTVETATPIYSPFGVGGSRASFSLPELRRLSIISEGTANTSILGDVGGAFDSRRNSTLSNNNIHHNNNNNSSHDDTLKRHSIETSPNPSSSSATDMSKLKCFCCGEFGHKACHCPKNPQWSGDTAAVCTVHGRRRSSAYLRPLVSGAEGYECVEHSRCRDSATGELCPAVCPQPPVPVDVMKSRGEEEGAKSKNNSTNKGGRQKKAPQPPSRAVVIAPSPVGL
eukprot:PhM_4_TR3028/c1_g1_i1/m.41402